jgi:hypothetical protein
LISIQIWLDLARIENIKEKNNWFIYLFFQFEVEDFLNISENHTG